MTWKPCAEPGCPTLSEAPYCAEHQRQRRRAADARRPGRYARGYDSRWKRTRRRYLAAHPRCVDCGAKATDVDHLDGLGPNGPRGHDWSNLEATCHSCHSKRTARHQPGGWNAR